MAWRVAKCLNKLLEEINASAPNRSKVSDGSIGDEDHQSTDSDHNPWCQGWVVTARDFTHDPANGFDSYTYAEWQRKRCRGDILLNGKREIRVKYIISNRKVASPTNNWAWRTYNGSNPHDHHVHISVDCTAEGGYMDSTDPWGWGVDMSDLTNQVWNEQPTQIQFGLDRPATQALADVHNSVHNGDMLRKIEAIAAEQVVQGAKLDQILALLQSGVPIPGAVNLTPEALDEIEQRTFQAIQRAEDE